MSATWRGGDAGRTPGDAGIRGRLLRILEFQLSKGEELIGYPVSGADGAVNVGHRRFNIMWYRPVAPGADLRSMFTGTDGVHYETGIPPSLVRPELVAAMKEEAHRVFPTECSLMSSPACQACSSKPFTISN